MMAASGWSEDPLLFANVIDKEVSDRCIELATKIFEGAVQRTPVYTGNLRASWRMSPESPDTSIETGGTKGSPLSAPSTPRLSSTQRYPSIIVSNNTPYASVVENGGPKNQPRYMLKLAIQAATRT